MNMEKKNNPHFHVNEHGILVKCYHETRNQLASLSFWIGMTIGFPLEHFIWEKLPGFSAITKWLGL